MNKKKFFWGALLVIALIILACSILYIIKYYTDGNSAQEYLGGSSQQIVTDENGKELYVENHNINWNELHDTNTDVYSWIYIPNTNVDYPILQATGDMDDSYYLTHDIKGNSILSASIYSEKQNAKDFSDPVTLIYGHNMKNGSMFASLHKFEDSKFFKKNKYIYIYMPKKRLTYKIYSAYVYDDRHILNSFDFTDPKIRMEYFNYTLNPESFSKNTRSVKLNKNSKIITLSTCTNGAENTRYLVQGVLIADEQTY